MLKYLPNFIDPRQLAIANRYLKGNIDFSKMTRLHNNLYDTKGYITINWLFSLDDKNRPTIQGDTEASLSIICQRCLQPVIWLVKTYTRLIMLNSESKNNELPSDYETIMMTDTPISLFNLVEDELILSLPITVTHEICTSNKYQITTKSKPIIQQNNPFQVLSQLKK
ncbi:MAG: DUF177 domain-containing protein [Thiomargarita sp.]|nr:DUF177 domain-containing protein [Thiomargarita sp.]